MNETSVAVPALMENGKVEFPDNVITNFSQANRVYLDMVQELDGRYKGYEKIRGLKTGAPPINKQKLAELGYDYLANVNWREYDAEARKIATSYKQAISGRTLVDIKLKKYSYKDNLFLQTKLSQILSEKIRSWPKYKQYIKTHIARIIDYGLAVLFFPDPDSPDFLSISPENFLFPHEGKLDFDFLPYCGIKHKYDPQFLYRAYQKGGEVWNKEALGQLLYLSSRYSDPKIGEAFGIFNFKDLALRINNRRDYFVEAFNGPIEVVTILAKEYSGKVTKLIFSPTHPTADLVYYKSEAYKNYDEALTIFTFRDDIEFLTEAKGFGQETYTIYHHRNLLNNSVVNNVRLGSTKFVSHSSGESANAKRLKIAPGGVNIVPQGIQPLDFKWNSDVTDLVNGVSYLKALENSSSPHLEANKIPSGNSQVKISRDPQDRIKSVRVQKEAVDGFLAQMDTFIKVLVGKILSDKTCPIYKEIVEQWESETLPMDVFDFAEASRGKYRIPKNWEVNVSKVVLYEQEQIAALYASGQVFDSRAFRRLLKLFVESQTDLYLADYLLPEEEADQAPTRDYTHATIAANQMEEGKEVVWSPDLDHEAYIDVILARCEDWIRRYNEAEDQLAVLQPTAVALQGLINFVATSIQYLARDKTKKDKNELYNQRFYMIIGIANGIYANAQKNQEAIVRKQMELEAAKNGTPTDPKVLDVLVNAELKKLKQATDSQILAGGQQIRFAEKLAEIQSKTVLDQAEMKAKAAIDEEASRREQNRKDIEVVEEIKRDNLKAANELANRPNRE